MGPAVTFRPAGPADAATIHALTQSAFAEYSTLDPPSTAWAETEELVLAELVATGGALAMLGDRPVACLRWNLGDDEGLWLRRLAVDPAHRGNGIGRLFVAWFIGRATGRDIEVIHVGVRRQLPANRRFFERLGFEFAHDHGYWAELRLPLSTSPNWRQ